MATLDTDIEIFINRAQQKIGTLGDTILLNDTQGICVDYDISLIQELSAAVDMFQNACCTPDENLSYKTIHYLTEKAGMSVIPIVIFDNNCLVDTVLLPSGGYIEGQKGDKGDAATIAIGTVTTLPAGDSATVTNSGNSSAAIFDFGIPAGAAGSDGDDGDDGWSPIYGIVVDGERDVLQLIGWTGGTGTEPGATGYYLGITGFVADIADAVNIRGSQGDDGTNGINGNDGWTPIVAIVNDGERRVLQVVSWTGGTGTAPDSGLYVSDSGFTDDIALAIDIRGEQGIQGDPFTINASGLLSDRNTYDDQGAGFTYLATDTGDVYIKNSILSGDWGPPISFVGQKGWSPVLNTVEDGDRVVLRVSDWIGGEGTKPSVGGYISPDGFASDIASGTDIRGLRGEFFIDVADFLSDRGSYDSEERPFTYYATDNGKIYLKNSDALADWTTGFDWRGERGADGEVGSQGANAFTITTGTFTVPAVSSTVNVSVQDTSWMGVGQVLFIETAGYYIVSSISSSAVVVLQNTGYTGNAAPTTLIAVSQKTSPGGVSGASVDTSTLWNISGNTLAARGKFGSISGAYGWDDYINNVVVGGIANDGKRYMGTNAAYASTYLSVRTQGNSFATYGFKFINTSDMLTASLDDAGIFSAYGGLGTDGAAAIFTDVTNARMRVGDLAGVGASGVAANYFGYAAGYTSSSSYANFFGPAAGYGASGDQVDGIGREALFGNTGSNVKGIGYQACKDNTLSAIFSISYITDFFLNNVGDKGYTTLQAVTMQTAMALDGTNQSAAASILRFASARGTGSGASGDLQWMYSPALGSGTTRQTLALSASMDGGTGEFTFEKDLLFGSDAVGPILIDRTTATAYRLYVYSGVLSIEAV